VDPAAVTSTSLISYSQPAGQPGVPCFASGSNSAPPVLRSLSAQRRRRCCPTQSTRFRHKFGTSVLQVCESAVAKDPEQVVHLGTSGKAATTTGASQPRRAAASPKPSSPPLTLTLTLCLCCLCEGDGQDKISPKLALYPPLLAPVARYAALALGLGSRAVVARLPHGPAGAPAEAFLRVGVRPIGVQKHRLLAHLCGWVVATEGWASGGWREAEGASARLRNRLSLPGGMQRQGGNKSRHTRGVHERNRQHATAFSTGAALSVLESSRFTLLAWGLL